MPDPQAIAPIKHGHAAPKSAALVWLCLSLAGWTCGSSAANAPHAGLAVIPAPARVELREGSFPVTARTPIYAEGGEAPDWVARYFAGLLRQSGGPELTIATPRGHKRPVPGIQLILKAGASQDPEGYELSIGADGVRVAAQDPRGLFYGVVTLWQLMTSQPATTERMALPALRIVDRPRFHWRGLMLDSARHFQAPEFIERFIDAMAIHKLNVLHWHLTDDQAWRLEIRKYPRLTEVGAWRVPAGHAAANDIDLATGRPRLYGGFYSQDTVRRIVAYAAQRGVTIVPEIEMPGHASAAIVAYPSLGILEAPSVAVPADWGIYPNLYNADESTFRFLEDVLDEVIGLFPGEYIHVGGDEAVKDQWKASPRIQSRMRELGIADETGLQNYFVRRVDDYLREHGRRLVGWDEILEGDIAAGATVMSWRGLEGALTAARSGHDTVLSPWPTLYLDNRQSDSVDDPPGRGRIVTLEDMYRFNPMPPELAADQRRHVLGLQADAWTEHMRTEERVEFMTFPRAAAMAEVGWSPADRLDWDDFMARLEPQFRRYHALGIDFAGSVFQPRIEARPVDGHVMLGLSNQGGFGEIRYTLDGSDPKRSSSRFREDLDLPARGQIRAATFLGERRLSPVAARQLDVPALARRRSRELKLCSDQLVTALEDDAPLRGSRAVFLIDLMNPCWIYTDADLSGGATVSAAVGQVPFNFQIGEDVNRIRFRSPRSPAGELEVRIDGCDGEPVAILPLAPAALRDDVTALPPVRIDPRGGRHDLCLSFTQSGPDPMWAIDWVGLDR